jgi:hypothetical protein
VASQRRVGVINVAALKKFVARPGLDFPQSVLQSAFFSDAVANGYAPSTIQFKK